MNAIESMLIDVARNFYQDIYDVDELSHLNEKLLVLLENSLSYIDINQFKNIFSEYYKSFMKLYLKYPDSKFIDKMMKRSESILQIINTINENK